MPSTPSPPIPPLLLTTLRTQHLPTPSQHFLHPIIAPPSQRPPPLPALIATTKHRLLSLSLTLPNLLDPSTHALPSGVDNPSVREYILNTSVPVQVVDIWDIGVSRGEVLGGLVAERMGERRRGREVVRVVDEDEDKRMGEEIENATSGSGSVSQARNRPIIAPTQTQTDSKGPYKLLLQDHKGTQVYAFTTSESCNAHPGSMQKIALPPRMQIGCKIMLLPGTRVCRGMVWLEGETCVVLGGRVEGLDRVWREGWEERVRGEVERMRGGVGG